MRESRDVFHLAIPVFDLDEAQEFYVAKLGCKLARRYQDRITLDFFGDQVVCHLSPEPASRTPIEDLQMYPRHFGVTFREEADFDRLMNLARDRGIPFFAEPTLRFEGMVEVHRTAVLADPFGNLLEFKYYFDHRMMY